MASVLMDLEAPPDVDEEPIIWPCAAQRRLAKFRQNVARFRLYRLRFLQENMRFAAFFKIYQILKLKILKFDKN